jgi:hypothetical protein
MSPKRNQLPPDLKNHSRRKAISGLSLEAQGMEVDGVLVMR